MRTCLLLFFVVVTSYFGLKGETSRVAENRYVKYFTDQLADTWSSVIYRKKLMITGTRYLSDESIRKSLPVDRSIIWWHLNRKHIERELLKHPLISSAKINGVTQKKRVVVDNSLNQETCWYNCFRIDIQERVAQYTAFVNGQPWMIGDDGVFIRPLPLNIAEEVGANPLTDNSIKTKEQLLRAQLIDKGLNVIVLSGIIEPSMSPDIVSSRVKYLNQVVPVVESELRKKISILELNQKDELVINFDDLKFPAIFDFAKDDLSNVGKGAHRLEIILNKFKGKEYAIKSVDLGYDKLAVVKLKT